MLSLSVIVTSCDQLATPLSAYTLWRNSDEAEDLNGDRKIDEDDYAIYLNPLTDYEIWKDSDDAEDLNGDRKINEDDYAIFLNPDSDYDLWLDSSNAEDLNNDDIINEADYTIYLSSQTDYLIWKNSDNAEDLNGDRKIDVTDYVLYLNPQSDYEIWKNSNHAEDLNADKKIDEADYVIYLEFSEFAGNYHIENYVYVGANFVIYNDYDNYSDEDIKLKDIGQFIEEIIIVVDHQGDFYASIPDEVIARLGLNFPTVLEALNAMSISRISPYLVALDTQLTLEDVLVSVTLYLSEIENGYSTTYAIDIDGLTAQASFDIIKDSTIDPNPESAYESWLDSEYADDLNDDSLIDEDDYIIYLESKSEYEAWKNSDEAEDLNGDRRIDEIDYDLYLNPESDYELWLDSTDAQDLNADGIINEDDYTIYLEYSEFSGNYHIENYTYSGDNIFIYSDLDQYNETDINLRNIDQYLEQIIITVGIQGDFYASIPSDAIANLGDSFPLVLDVLNQMSIERLSPYLVVLDTSVTVESVEIHASLYLIETLTGFSTTYVANVGSATATISFDLIKD